MRKYAILGDSTCDLNRNLRKQYDIDYISMNFVMDDKEYTASLDWEEISARTFYDAMRGGSRITTTQVPAERYERLFRNYLEQEMDVLYVSCSSALSGSINTAQVVAKELTGSFPEAKIFCVDALNSSFGQGIQLMQASSMRREGKTIEEVRDYLEANRNCVNQVGFVEKLDYLKRAGRVTASSAFFGNLIGIKPILISDAKGQNFAVKKVKGMTNAIRETVEIIKNRIIEPETQTIYVSHADAAENAKTLAQHIKEATGCKEVFIDLIGPIVGASVGPGTLIAYYIGEEETQIGEA